MEGITKTFTLTGTKGVSAQVTVTETYNAAANTSDVQVAVKLALSSYYGHTYYLTGSVSAGKTLQTMVSSDGTHYVTVSKLDTYYPIAAGSSDYQGSPWTRAGIAHNSDGSLDLTVAVDIRGYEPSGKGANGFSVAGSRTVTLTTIPRASTIGATDAAIESVSTVSVSRKSTGYTHSVAYAFGSLTGYLTSGGGTSSTEKKFTASSIPFTLPTSFYGQIPDSKTGTCTLTCRTYSGATQIGEAKTCAFTVTAAKSKCAPAVSGTVWDSNETTIALTGNRDLLVRYMSNARCEITATAKNGATITQKVVGGNVTTGRIQTIKNTEKDSYLFSATDSRGYKTSLTVKATLIPYIPLTCVASGYRPNPTDGTAEISVKGDCFNGSFGATANSLTLRYKGSGGSWISVTPTLSGNRYSAKISLTGLAYTQSFTYTLEVSDALQTVTKTVTVKKGIPVFDWGENDFSFHVPVWLENGMHNKWVSNSTDLDTVQTTGVYSFYTDNTSENKPCSLGEIIAVNRTADIGTQIAIDDNVGHPRLLIRKRSEGTWGAWRYMNPRMTTGVEYLTMELSEGEPVYVTALNFGTLPSSGSTSVSLATGLDVIDISGVAYNSQYVCPLGSCAAINEVWYQVSNGKIYISAANATAADYKAYVIVKYNKL